ncbi:MAG: hypothetical protein R3B72_16280 [Polyangiaceae bacterium]
MHRPSVACYVLLVLVAACDHPWSDFETSGGTGTGTETGGGSMTTGEQVCASFCDLVASCGGTSGASCESECLEHAACLDASPFISTCLTATLGGCSGCSGLESCVRSCWDSPYACPPSQ